MQNGQYEIVSMRRTNHGKWVFTARKYTIYITKQPIGVYCSLRCAVNAMEGIANED